MPIGPRVSSPNSGNAQFGDSLVGFFQYADTSGSLTNGMPVYLNVTDAAQFNSLFASTSTNTICSPGKVILATNVAVGPNPTCVGVYQPINPGEKPVNGALIRVIVYGYGIVSTVVPAGGTSVTVGSKLISTTTNQAEVGVATTDKTIGTVLATGTALTVGATITAVPGSGSTVTLVNAFIKLV